MQSKCVGLIPARLSSTRLPGKALADIAGMPLVIHTAKRALMADRLDDVFVCTDSEKIASICEDYKIKAIKTSEDFNNGTERIAEASEGLGADFFIDIQGDEPLIDPKHIDAVAECLVNSSDKYDIILPVLKVPYTASDSIVRVQITRSNRVMTLSRANIPHIYSQNPQHIFKHLSIVGFTRESLAHYSNLEKSHNESIESVELLRALENDMTILALPLNGDSFSVDLQDDLDRARLAIVNDQYFGKY